MSESKFNGLLLSAVATQQLQGIDTDFTEVRRAMVRASLAPLTPEQLADAVISRVIIERAKGLLVQIYDVDPDNAFELLRWWSQATNVKLRILARRLTDEFTEVDNVEPHVVRAECDTLLLTGHGAPRPHWAGETAVDQPRLPVRSTAVG